jgi:hypothetical protein
MVEVDKPQFEYRQRKAQSEFSVRAEQGRSLSRALFTTSGPEPDIRLLR